MQLEAKNIGFRYGNGPWLFQRSQFKSWNQVKLLDSRGRVDVVKQLFVGY